MDWYNNVKIFKELGQNLTEFMKNNQVKDFKNNKRKTEL